MTSAHKHPAKPIKPHLDRATHISCYKQGLLVSSNFGTFFEPFLAFFSRFELFLAFFCLENDNFFGFGSKKLKIG
jgi:hypothetical protein